jgi:lipopolysaccharide export system protein LptA
MTQGSMQMKANKVELVRKNDDIDSIIATGTPASFQQKPAANKPITTAYGMKMVYKIKDQTITITDKAKVVQEKDSFSGERIVYQMDKAIVNAYGGSGSSGERVQMIIQPKAK